MSISQCVRYKYFKYLESGSCSWAREILGSLGLPSVGLNDLILSEHFRTFEYPILLVDPHAAQSSDSLLFGSGVR